MGFLKHLGIAKKLLFLNATILAGMCAFAILAFFTLSAVRINSPLYNEIALAYQLAGDCYDPPASLVAALPAVMSAEDAATPAPQGDAP